MEALVKRLVNIVIVLIIMIGIFVMLVLYKEAETFKRISYNDLNQFIEKSDIPYYEMYDLCSYVFDHNKELISDADEVHISHYKDQIHSYTLEHSKQRHIVCSYDIHYNNLSFDKPTKDSLYHELDHGQVIIEKDINAHCIIIKYQNDHISYSCSLYFDNINIIDLSDYEQIILEYIEDNNLINN